MIKPILDTLTHVTLIFFSIYIPILNSKIFEQMKIFAHKFFTKLFLSIYSIIKFDI